MYLLKLKARRNFARTEESVRFYASDCFGMNDAGWARFTMGATDPKRRTLDVLVRDYGDLGYIVNDLTYDPLLSEAIAYHVTNDEHCTCTPCSEGGLDMIENA
jgi:hypothetical protein